MQPEGQTGEPAFVIYANMGETRPNESLPGLGHHLDVLTLVLTTSIFF